MTISVTDDYHPLQAIAKKQV